MGVHAWAWCGMTPSGGIALAHGRELGKSLPILPHQLRVSGLPYQYDSLISGEEGGEGAGGTRCPLQNAAA